MPSLDMDEVQDAQLPAGVAAVSAQLAASRAAQSATAAARSPVVHERLKRDGGPTPARRDHRRRRASCSSPPITYPGAPNLPFRHSHGDRGCDRNAVRLHAADREHGQRHLRARRRRLRQRDVGCRTYTVPTGTFRDFVVSFPTATSCTITTTGTGTWS